MRFMPPSGGQMSGGMPFSRMESQQNIPQTSGASGTQVHVGQPFQGYNPYVVGTQVLMGHPHFQPYSG
jgi:hypothetical protein